MTTNYLIDNITSHIESGWYDELSDGWFPMIGFELGMIHGGMIDPDTHQLCRSSDSLVIMSDPDFTRGYHAGRRYYFFEAPHEERRLTDTFLVESFHSWALEYHLWNEPEPCLRFALGCRVGELSGELLPMSEQERSQIEAEDRQFLAEYEASRAELLHPSR